MHWDLKNGIATLNSKHQSHIIYFILSEINIFSVLVNDLARTRSNEAFFQKESTKRNLRYLTTFYCKSNNVNYQQGLLEVYS